VKSVEEFRARWRLARRFTPDLAEHRLAFASVLALAVVVALCQVVAPWPIQWIFDHALAPSTPQPRDPYFYVWTGALGLLLVTLVQAACEYLSQIALAKIGQKVSRNLRLRLFQHLAQLSPRFYARHKSGDLLMRLLGDVGMVRATLVDTTVELLTRSIWIFGVVAVMLWRDWRLTATLMAVLPLVAWVVRRMSRQIESNVRKQREKEGALADYLQETLAANEVIQSLGRVGSVTRRMARDSRSTERAGQRSARLSAKLTTSVHALLGLGVAVTLCIGAWRVVRGELSSGELLVFISYVRGVLKPVRSASRNSEKFAKGFACAKRIVEVLDEPIAVRSMPGAPPASSEPRELAFEHVRFRYEADRDALRGFSARFRRGELNGVFGASGAGKSTVAALAVRLFDPESGAVKLDGRDLRELDLDSLRERFGVCLQRPILFGETVRENLAMGSESADDAQMWKALDEAGAAAFVRSLPQGLDTQLDSGGGGFSGGQARRVALARTLLRRAPIVVVDEPFAGLDQAVARHVLNGLRRLAQTSIVVVIAHEHELLPQYDQIVFVEQGRVTDAGAHGELLERCGSYREVLRVAERRAAPVELAP